MTLAVGIDLGTSNSAVAVIEASGRPRIFTTAEGSTTMPSLVWFAPDGPRVGEAARAGLEQDPDQTVAGVKRLLGRAFTHPMVRQLNRSRKPCRMLPGVPWVVHRVWVSSMKQRQWRRDPNTPPL